MRKETSDYVKVCKAYAESFHHATQYVKTRKSLYRYPAKTEERHLDYENGLLKMQLQIEKACPLVKTKRIISETACRIIPFGGVSAEVREYEPNRYYSILYNGTIEFFGSICATAFALLDEINKEHNYNLGIQKLIDSFFGLALIYYDFGLDAGTYDARHSIYYDLREEKRPSAGFLATVATKFLFLHEIGHIIDKNEPFDNKEKEFSADFFSFTSLRETAFRFQNNAEIELTIIGCVLALSSIKFIEETFPGIDMFPSLSTNHPSANERLNNILDKFPHSMLVQLKSRPIYKETIFMFDKISELILDGGRPSYWNI